MIQSFQRWRLRARIRRAEISAVKAKITLKDILNTLEETIVSTPDWPDEDEVLLAHVTNTLNLVYNLEVS